MTRIVVKENILSIGDKSYRCAYGKNGFTNNKREGDSATPLGIWELGRLFYRGDKLELQKINLNKVALTTIKIEKSMGWSDDSADKNYNQLITLPSNFSHELLWRDDDSYDIVIELKYNDNPAIAGRGSAIFFHIAKPEYSGTEGCIAVSMNDMIDILSRIDGNSDMEIITP